MVLHRGDHALPRSAAASASATSWGRRTTSTSVSTPPQPGTVETMPISQVSSASWTWAGRKSASPMNDATNLVAGRSNTPCGVSSCSTRPARMTTTRSPTESASVWSWVTSTAVVLVSRSTADQLGAHLGAQRLVERGERLVEEDDGRTGRERPRQGDPLLLSAAQLVGVARREVSEPDQGQHLGDPRGALCPSRAGRARSRRCEPRSGAGRARGPGRPARPGDAPVRRSDAAPPPRRPRASPSRCRDAPDRRAAAAPSTCRSPTGRSA